MEITSHKKGFEQKVTKVTKKDRPEQSDDGKNSMTRNTARKVAGRSRLLQDL
jgi:hypothetical protein